MTIDVKRIATAAAKAAVARQGGKPVERAPGFDGPTFQRVYFANSGKHELFGRALREYEIATLAGTPDAQLKTAHHQIIQAKNMMQANMEDSPTMQEAFRPEPKQWCQGVASWPESMCDRLFPAFSAIEALGIDPDGQYRREYGRMLDDFNAAICSIDQKTATLKGASKWKARWKEYKAEITDFYFDAWMEYIESMRELTRANDQGFIIWGE